MTAVRHHSAAVVDEVADSVADRAMYRAYGAHLPETCAGYPASMEHVLAQLPHHDGSPLYVSDQTPELGETVRVRVRVPRAFGTMRIVRTRSNPDREPSFSDAVVVHETPSEVWWEAAILVENPVHGYRFLMEADDGSTW